MPGAWLKGVRALDGRDQAYKDVFTASLKTSPRHPRGCFILRGENKGLMIVTVTVMRRNEW